MTGLVAAGALVASGLAAAAAPAAAAPQLTITVSNCTITKVGGQYQYSATGSYSAQNSTKDDFKINAYKAELRNNGGQNLQSITYTQISPTTVFNVTLFSGTVDYRFASSLKDVRFWVYNGGSQKGYSATNCQRIGW